jgi:hypothetical protein
VARGAEGDTLLGLTNVRALRVVLRAQRLGVDEEGIRRGLASEWVGHEFG